MKPSRRTSVSLGPETGMFLSMPCLLISSPLLYNVYSDDINHHLQATCVGCYVGGAWVNSPSYADDMVLLAPKE